MKPLRISTAFLFFSPLMIALNTFGQNSDRTIDGQKVKLTNELSLMGNEIHKRFKELQSFGEKYGWESNETNELRGKNDIENANCLNTLEEIIKTEVWHGDGELGDQLISNLFSIIHYEDTAIRRKYLPFMQVIVLKSKAQADGLAVIADNLSMMKKEKQVYGSIIINDKNLKIDYVYPLLDPDNVDKRRKAIGLDSFATYLYNFNMQWDVEQYKSDLSKYERLEKEKN